MSKTYYNQTIAITARPRSKRLREAGGYYTAVTVGKNANSNAGQTAFEDSGLFEKIVDPQTSETVGAKALHDLYIIQTPADEEATPPEPEVLKDITEILRHLSLQVVTPAQGDPYTVLVSDITLASMRNVVAGGVGDGSGGTGGGSLASLADVTLTSPAVGDTLVFDSTNHWVNVPLNLNALADVEVGTPANGQALLWNATLGKWIPGTVQGSGGGGTGSISVVGLTMPTGFTVTGSPLTTDGTIAVTMATGYAIPTTDYLSLFSFNKSGNTITSIKPNYSMILGTAQLPLSLSVFGGASVKSLVCSTATQTSDNSVGTAASPWYAIYGTTIYEGGTALASKYQAKLPSGATDGQVLTWSNGAWVAGNSGGGGGISSVSLAGGTNAGTLKLTVDGTVTDNIAVTGLAAVATSNSYNDLDDKPDIQTPGAGVLTIKMNNASKGTFSADATSNAEIDLGTVITSLSGYATQTWVGQQGYITSSALSGYATQTWVGQQGFLTSSALSGYATESWVTNKGYITSAALSGYATEAWVTNKGYLTAHQSLGLYAGQASGTSNYETSDPYIILTGGGTNKGAVRLKGAGSVTVSSDANGVVTITGSGSGPGTIPAADANTLGGIKLGFTSASRNFGVAVDENNRAYVSVPDTVVSVPSTVPTIGTSETTLGTVGGTTIKAKIASYLLASDFTAANIVSTLGTTAVNRATADASGNTITSAYLRKNTNDTMEGNLAIGTSSSSKKLTIYGTTSAALTIYGSGSTYSTNIYRDSSALQVSGAVSLGGNTSIGGTLDTTGSVTIGSSSSTSKKLILYGSTSAGIEIYGGSNGPTKLYRTASALVITGSSGNAVNIGTSSISQDFKVFGNINATGNIIAGVSSDRRLKKDIRSISHSEAADLLSVLNPVVFQWNETAAELGELHGVARGFLADEYLDLLPNAGRKIWGEYDAIDYNQVIPYLVAGWQQQNLRIRILEGEIAVLKEDNQRLRRVCDVV